MTYPYDSSILSCCFNGGNGADGDAMVASKNEREVVGLALRRDVVLDQLRHFSHLQTILAINVFKIALDINTELWVSQQGWQLLPSPSDLTQYANQTVVNQSTATSKDKLIKI